MRYPTCAQPEYAADLPSICCAPGCRGAAHPRSPVPLCPSHLRRAYEFAADLIGDRTTLALAELHSDAIKGAPVPCDELPVTADTPGFVYFVRFRDRIKIGWTSNPDRRLPEIPHEELLALVPGTMADERAIHRKFYADHDRGEWFRETPRLLAFIAGIEDWSAAAI